MRKGHMRKGHMRKGHMRNGLLGALLSLCLALPACREQPQSPAQQSDRAPAKPAAPQPTAPQPPPPVPAPVAPRVAAGTQPPDAIPPVLLSEQHRAWCKVFVGDKFPAIRLPDLKGKETELTSLYGDLGTVVLFWEDRSDFTVERLRDAYWDVAANYLSAGIQVVGIFRGSDVAVAQRLLSEAEADFPCLVDTAGRAWQEVGSEEPIRTYLLDREGTILWFDLGYDRSSRRELGVALSELADSQGE